MIYKRPKNQATDYSKLSGDLNLKSTSQIDAKGKKSRHKLASEKGKIYKRSNSVPPKQQFFAQRTEFVQSPSTLEQWRLNSIRDRSASPTFWRANRRGEESVKNCRNFWKQMEIGISDTECDKEVAQYCRSRRSRWQRSNSPESNRDSSENVIITKTTNKTETCKEYRYRIPVHFDYYENRQQDRQEARDGMRNQNQRRKKDQTNISRVYLSPYDLQMQNNIIKNLQPLRATGLRYVDFIRVLCTSSLTLSLSRAPSSATGCI